LKTIRRELVDPAIAAHRGRIVKTVGDGILVEFSSVVDAVTCAMAVQGKMAERSDIAAKKMNFRIGINIGEAILDGDDIFGDGVNIAARVENECEPGGVFLSGQCFLTSSRKDRLLVPRPWGKITQDHRSPDSALRNSFRRGRSYGRN
jgi:adenylate cyclase